MPDKIFNLAPVATAQLTTKHSIFGLCVEGFPDFLAEIFGPDENNTYEYVFGLFMVFGRPYINQMTFDILATANDAAASLDSLSRQNISVLTARPYRMDHTLPFPTKNVIGQVPTTQELEDRENLPLQSIAVTDTNYSLTSKLQHHKSWADEVFFSRSDLKLMHDYLYNFDGNYNDFFFSGTKVNYGKMANPGFDLAWRKGNHNVQDDPSDCFTLKAEPVFMHPLVATRSRGPFTAKLTTAEEENLIPGLFTAAPCPFYWEVWKRTIGELDAHPSPSFNFAAFVTKFPNLSSFRVIAAAQNLGT